MDKNRDKNNKDQSNKDDNLTAGTTTDVQDQDTSPAAETKDASDADEKSW